MKRISREELNILICQLICMRATCRRAAVGCVITKSHRIISSGYNGALDIDNCELQCNPDIKCTHAIHAEENAICAAAREGISLVGTHLYCSYEPCYECCKLIVQAGISKVFYLLEYHTPGKALLEKMGIQVKQVIIQHDQVQNNKQQEGA